ncbi:MAG: GNAT family N-acetyltransferase [Acidimicrobiales bacterium]
MAGSFDVIAEVDGIRYAHIEARWADALEALEYSAFSTIDRDDLYSAADLVELARVFREGNFVALDGDEPVGMGLGLFMDFDFDDADHNLTELGGEGGWEAHDPEGDWYYGTDISVYPNYRGRGIGKQLYELRKQLVRDHSKAGIVAGGVIPGFADHKADMSAAEYIDKVRAGELHDPTLTFQLANGFEARGAIADYLDDPTVDGWAVLIVWPNPETCEVTTRHNLTNRSV